jgi:hypothetical protein
MAAPNAIDELQTSNMDVSDNERQVAAHEGFVAAELHVFGAFARDAPDLRCRHVL